MKISYTGKPNALTTKQRAKLEAKLQKLSKMLERKGEKEAHIILTQERFLHKVEITLHAMDRSLVGAGSDGDVVLAAHDAVEKLEKQVLKQRTKWRDTKRHKEKGAVAEPAAKPARAVAVRESASPNGPVKRSKRVFRVNHGEGSKPMTLEEAMLEMEASQDYLVYRDAQTDRVSVLMRRPDGHFDLIES